MAGSVKDKPKPKGKTPAAASENGLGHNLDVLRTKGAKAMNRFFKLQDTMDSEMAKYRSDFGHAYDDEATNLGIPKKLLIAEFKRALKKKREREKEMMMEPNERETTEAFRAAMEGTPMGEWFKGEVARAPKEG